MPKVTEMQFHVIPMTFCLEIEGDVLLAQSAIFFVAGLETSAITIALALDHLARNPSMQKKLRDEIQEKITENGGELNYEAFKEMKYLQQVVNETLRHHPSAPLLDRFAETDYKVIIFRGFFLDIKLPKLMKVFFFFFATDPGHWHRHRKRNRHTNSTRWASHGPQILFRTGKIRPRQVQQRKERWNKTVHLYAFRRRATSMHW